MTDRKTNIDVLNGFDNPATITLLHRSGTSPEEGTTWQSVPFGQMGTPPLTVNYVTGFASPNDFWHVTVVVSDGPNKGTWQNQDWKGCYLEDEDRDLTLQFSVSPDDGFKLNMNSDGCQTDLYQG